MAGGEGIGKGHVKKGHNYNNLGDKSRKQVNILLRQGKAKKLKSGVLKSIGRW